MTRNPMYISLFVVVVVVNIASSMFGAILNFALMHTVLLYQLCWNAYQYNWLAAAPEKCPRPGMFVSKSENVVKKINRQGIWDAV